MQTGRTGEGLQANLAFTLSLVFHGLVFFSAYFLATQHTQVRHPVQFEIHRVKPPEPEVKEKNKEEKTVVDLTKLEHPEDLQKLKDMKIHRSSKATTIEKIKPVVGVSEDSTSETGSFPVPVGNTLMGTPENKVQEVNYAPLFLVVELPRFRERIEPDYPERAKRAGIEGTVILEVSIDEEGRVIDAAVKQGLGYGCDQAALEAVRKARFHPARAEDGNPVAVKVPIPFRFRIIS